MRKMKTVELGGREVTVAEASMRGMAAHLEGQDEDRPAGTGDVLELWAERLREVWGLCVVDLSFEEFRSLVREGDVYPSEVEALAQAIRDVNGPFVRTTPGTGEYLEALLELLPRAALRSSPEPADSCEPATPEPGTTA